MALIRISELPESITLDDETVFPMVFNNVTQKITFESLKQVMLYYTDVDYDEYTGKFIFTRSNNSNAILSTPLYQAFKKAEVVDSDIVFTDFADETYTIDLMTDELTEKLEEIAKNIQTNADAIATNAKDIATNKANIATNASSIKAINDSKGTAGGFAELDENGQVPSSQLPSYVDDVVEGYLYEDKFYEDEAHTTEIEGESGKIYIDLETAKTYRWSGTIFTVISETLALGETSSTAYRGDRGKEAYDHKYTIGNPHETTAEDIGLGNVDNTADANKVVAEANKTTGTLTIQKNGTTVKSYNGSADTTANIEVPTKTSDLANDSDFITSEDTIAVANKIGTETIGGSTTPVYINEGTPTAIAYTIGKSVPADALFTDTTYENATTSKSGLMSTSDKSKLDNIAENADDVEWTQNVSSGVNIANITINGEETKIYAPTSQQYLGDMEKATYDTDDNGIVDEAEKTTGTLTIRKYSSSTSTDYNSLGTFNGSSDVTVDIKSPHIIEGGGTELGSTTRYYKLAKLSNMDSTANYQSIYLHGRVGGWTADSGALINLLIKNRDADIVSGNIFNYYDALGTHMNIVIYTNEDGTQTVYLYCLNYYCFNLELILRGASLLYDGTYIEEEPEGTLAYSLLSDTTILRVDRNGNVIAKGFQGDLIGNVTGNLVGEAETSSGDKYVTNITNSRNTTTTTYGDGSTSLARNYTKFNGNSTNKYWIHLCTFTSDIKTSQTGWPMELFIYDSFGYNNKPFQNSFMHLTIRPRISI